MAETSKPWGPWMLPAGDPERRAQFRSLAALSRVFLYGRDDLVQALRRAERDDEAALEALALLNVAPTVPRRRIIASFGALTYDGQPQRAPA